MNSPYGIALIRGLIGALISAGGVFFSTAPITDHTTALYAAGASAFAYLAVRFAGEGSFDSRSGAQKATDVHRAGEDTRERHIITDEDEV